MHSSPSEFEGVNLENQLAYLENMTKLLYNEGISLLGHQAQHYNEVCLFRICFESL